jgi:hypothetical protein
MTIERTIYLVGGWDPGNETYVPIRAFADRLDAELKLKELEAEMEAKVRFNSRVLKEAETFRKERKFDLEHHRIHGELGLAAAREYWDHDVYPQMHAEYIRLGRQIDPGLAAQLGPDQTIFTHDLEGFEIREIMFEEDDRRDE